MQKLISAFFSVLAIAVSMTVQAVSPTVSNLQAHWAEANYTLTGEAQTKSFEALIAEANEAITKVPNQADILIWRGIIHSSYAGIKGGMGALSLAKIAKADLEAALTLDDKALDGSAYTTLGTLYYKVPGWPVGFGDDDKAEALLTTALKLNPQGIDSNYFYALFMMDQQNIKVAEQYLLKAQQATPRPDRPLADQGRQADISKALQQVRYQLRKQDSANITH